MNAKLVAIALGFAAAAAHAGQNEQSPLQTIDVRADASLSVDCRNEKLPTRAAVGAVLETNNAGAIEAGRERLEHYAHRECMRGAPRVVFVRDASAATPALALAAAPAH